MNSRNIYTLSIIFVFFFFIGCSEDSPKKVNTSPSKQVAAKKTPEPAKEVAAKEKTKPAEPEKPKSDPTPQAHLDKAKEIIKSVDQDAVAAVDAKKKFKMLCTACHGMTGDLNINGATDLTLSKASMVERVAQIYHGKGLMTPFKGILKDEEIVAVAKYIEKLRS